MLKLSQVSEFFQDNSHTFDFNTTPGIIYGFIHILLSYESVMIPATLVGLELKNQLGIIKKY